MPGHFESYDREEVHPPSGRTFGLALALPFALIALAPLRHGGGVRRWAAAVSAAWLVLAAVAPALLARLAVLWTAVMRPVRLAVTAAAMALLFFLVVTPIGCMRRLWVRDPLRRRFDRQAASYWQKRDAASPQSMTNQF
jgi:hypothetical protein